MQVTDPGTKLWPLNLNVQSEVAKIEVITLLIQAQKPLSPVTPC